MSEKNPVCHDSSLLCIFLWGTVPCEFRSPSFHVLKKRHRKDGRRGYMTTIRIYNDPNDKRTFVNQMVQDFQEHEDISDFKASLFELTKEYFRDENISLQDVNIGFVGASNQKSFVNTSQQVYDAYNSRFLHKNELVLFIERHKEKRQTKKRSASTLDGK